MVSARLLCGSRDKRRRAGSERAAPEPRRQRSLLLPGIALALSLAATLAAGQRAPSSDLPVFSTADQCIACHSNLRDESGADVSIGHAWRATMMANAVRDPYWQAAVRREVMDNPELEAAIEDTCATCHMPMARTSARAQGRLGQVFAHLRGRDGDPAAESAYARDGVSCTVCHQDPAGRLRRARQLTAGRLRRRLGDLDTARSRRRYIGHIWPCRRSSITRGGTGAVSRGRSRRRC